MDRQSRIFQLALLGFCFLTVVAEAQKKPVYHVDADGKFYWKKDVPVYLFISEEPDQIQKRLESTNTGEYANPLYLDTEGVNFIRTSNAVDPKTKEPVPGVEILFEIYADSEPPITLPGYENVSAFENEGVQYYQAGLEVSFTSSDALSGVKTLFAGVNTNNVPAYAGAFEFSTAGNYLVRYFSEDNVGNVEDVNLVSFTIDPTPPFSDLNINGITEDKVVATSSKMYLLVEDSISGVDDVFYKFDDNEYTRYGGSLIPFDGLDEGDHTVYYYAVDNVKNTEEAKNFTFYLDKSAPLMVADVLGDRFIVEDEIYFSGRTKLKLTAVDNKVGVKEVLFSVDEEDFQKYEQPFYLPSVSGVHTIRYYSVDNLDNSTRDETKSRFIGQGGFEEFKHNVAKFYVDLTGPVISHEILDYSFERNDTLFIGPSTGITIAGSDPESGLNHLSYTLNNAAGEDTYEEKFTLNPNEGFHTLNYFGYDNVNNRNVGEFSFYFDKTAPEIGILFSIGAIARQDNKNVYPSNAGIYLYSTDGVSGVADLSYKVDDGEMRPYRGLVQGIGPGEHTLEIRATDNLGNESTKSVSFVIR